MKYILALTGFCALALLNSCAPTTTASSSRGALLQPNEQIIVSGQTTDAFDAPKLRHVVTVRGSGGLYEDAWYYKAEEGLSNPAEVRISKNLKIVSYIVGVDYKTVYCVAAIEGNNWTTAYGFMGETDNFDSFINRLQNGSMTSELLAHTGDCMIIRRGGGTNTDTVKG